MRRFGGMGGFRFGRMVNPDDAFEVAVCNALGQRMQQDDDLCRHLWGSLANVDWLHDNGDLASYSFRAAGDLIAAILGVGNYMDWYCSGEEGIVSDDVREAMAQQGWHPITDERET